MTSSEIEFVKKEASRLNTKYNTTLTKWGIVTPLERQHYFAQIVAETFFKLQRESLYYTKIQGARNAFKTPFKNKTDEFVTSYLKNSVKMANYVYANREGNGDEKSGDGYKYRGGGYLQNTHKNGYKLLEEKTGIKFVSNPDLILEEPNAIIAACVYWKVNNLNKYVSLDPNIALDRVSDVINIGRPTVTIGDSNGYKERLQAFNALKDIF